MLYAFKMADPTVVISIISQTIQHSSSGGHFGYLICTTCSTVLQFMPEIWRSHFSHFVSLQISLPVRIQTPLIKSFHIIYL